MENEYRITTEFIKSKNIPNTLFERIYKYCIKNIGYGYMPSIIELKKDEYSKFYIASKKMEYLSEISQLIKKAFTNESFYEFNEKEKKNPKRKLIVARRDKEYYGTIITNSMERDILMKFLIFNVEIRKLI